MRIIRAGNWSFQQPPFQDGDVIEGGNCMQLAPDTEICAGVKDLTIKGGNFVNCKPQKTWTVLGGNWAQVSRCSHEHPDWDLPECPEDCVHRQGDEKQWVEVDETEYRAHHADLSASKPAVRISKEDDSQGVTLQRFEKEVFVYRDVVTGNAREVA